VLVSNSPRASSQASRTGQLPGAWEGHANATGRLCTAEAFMMLKRHLEMHRGTLAGNKR
jgi:hypothetical protein